MGNKLLVALLVPLCCCAPAAAADTLESRFQSQIRPFVEQYCAGCHGSRKPKGDLDLSRDTSVGEVATHLGHWQRVLERLRADEMPPEDAPRRPTAEERTAVVAWARELRQREARRQAGDQALRDTLASVLL